MDPKLIAIPVIVIIAVAVLGSMSMLPKNEESIGDRESQTEAEIHILVNEQRANHGLEPLLYDLELGKIAKAHSLDMAKLGYFEHTAPSGITLTDRSMATGYECIIDISEDEYYDEISENLFKMDRIVSLTSESPKIIAQDAIDWWLAIPIHKKEMLDEYSGLSGVGVVFNEHSIYVTHDFC